MVAAGRAIGVILADRQLDAPPLDASERHLLWTLGKAAALASVARNVATQAETATQLRQRIDLAREVHEGVIQRLFGVSMVLDGDGDLPRPTVRARCASEIQAALGELRNAIQRPLGRGAARDARRRCPPRCSGCRRVHPELGIALRGRRPARSARVARAARPERAGRGGAQRAQARRADRRPRADRPCRRRVRARGRQRRRRPGRLWDHPGWVCGLAAFEALQSGGIVEFGAARARIAGRCGWWFHTMTELGDG